MIPFVLSILSAVVFWFFFSYLPECRRNKELRKKINLNLLQIYSEIFFSIDLCLRGSFQSPVRSQQKITSGSLAKDEIFICLQNKCLNESYFYYPEISKVLNPIGKGLYENYAKIDNKIESVFLFSSCLESNEVLLLEEIRSLIHKYHLDEYDRNACVVIDGERRYPVNPSLSYMADNIYEIYLKSIELFEVLSIEYSESKDVALRKVNSLFFLGDYLQCRALSNKILDDFKVSDEYLKIYIFICDLELGDIEAARKGLKEVMLNKPHLTGNRYTLGQYIDHESVSDIFTENYSDLEIQDLERVLTEEIGLDEQFYENAKVLKEFYANKNP